MGQLDLDNIPVGIGEIYTGMILKNMRQANNRIRFVNNSGIEIDYNNNLNKNYKWSGESSVNLESDFIVKIKMIGIL